MRKEKSDLSSRQSRRVQIISKEKCRTHQQEAKMTRLFLDLIFHAYRTLSLNGKDHMKANRWVNPLKPCSKT